MTPIQTKLTIGNYEVCPIPTGEFGLDGGAMFGTVPKVLWEKSNPPDDKNRIPMEARALLLKGKDKNILIDCGNGGQFVEKYGEKLGGKFSEMYSVKAGGNSLIGSLKKQGVSPEDIDVVLLTHLHFDHAGGSTSVKEGKLVATFPKAQYFVQKSNLENAKRPNIRERASYLSANWEPLAEAGKLTVVEGNVELLPGISAWVSNGHTQGHQAIKISDGKTTLLYCGDVIPTSSHVRLAWIMGYDLEPLKIIEEKNQLLTQAARENWYLYFEHDPYCDAAQVTSQKEDFVVSYRYFL
jgi:glyoxylase-like metal-dependent hydrolase (beta-lactamase superfamily II)